MKTKFFLLGMFAAFLFASCSSDDNNNDGSSGGNGDSGNGNTTKTFLISEVHQTINGEYKPIHQFTYNDEGLLIESVETEYEERGEHIQKYTYEYDADNKFKKASWQSKDPDAEWKAEGAAEVLAYDGNNITKVKYTNRYESYIVTYTWQGGKIVKITDDDGDEEITYKDGNYTGFYDSSESIYDDTKTEWISSLTYEYNKDQKNLISYYPIAYIFAEGGVADYMSTNNMKKINMLEKRIKYDLSGNKKAENIYSHITEYSLFNTNDDKLITSFTETHTDTSEFINYENTEENYTTGPTVQSRNYKISYIEIK